MHQTPLGAGLWFNPRSLEELADDGAWSRGLMLYRNQKVLSLEIEPDGDHWVLLGEVQGSLRVPYEVSVDVAITAEGNLAFWNSDCDCPVGQGCKHGVALTLKAAYKGLRLLGAEVGAVNPQNSRAPTPDQVEAARQAALARAADQAGIQAEAKLLEWLHAIDRAGSGQTTASGGGGDLGSAPAKAAERPEQFLYLLAVHAASTAKPHLHIQAVISNLKVTGGWAKPKTIKTPPYPGLPVYDRATPTDREVLELIRAMPSTHIYRYAHTYSASAVPQGQVGRLVLEQAASTGRLFLDDGLGGPGASVQWGAPQALQWEWHEVTNLHSPEPSWALRAKLAQSGLKLCLNQPPLYLDVARGLCGPVMAEGVAPAQLEVLLNAPPLKANALKKHQGDLVQRLGSLPLPPVLEQLAPLHGIVPTACLQLSQNPPEAVAGNGMIRATLRFDYAGHQDWWAGKGNAVIVENAAGRFLLHRDSEAEFDAINRLMGLGLRAASNGVFEIPGSSSQRAWLHWADNDYAVFKEAGFAVTVDDALTHWITHADALDVSLQAQGDDEATSPWFDLSLGMEINGQRHNILPWLPDLIAAAAHSPLDPLTDLPQLPPFVYVPSSLGKGFIRLPTDALKPWMAALLELVGDRAHDFTGDSLKLSRLDAMRTTAALGEGAVWEGAQHLRDMVQRLSGHTELPEVPVPAGVSASLRPYQQQGLNWLQFLREYGLGGILADDMGLGKTLQTLAHIQIEKDAGRLDRPALIIAPVSLMGNWRNEAERFCPGLRTLVIHGKDRHEVTGSVLEHDVIIAPYSLLPRDKEGWLDTPWHIVVLDEAQNIKNASTHAAQVVGQLNTRHRLCLSGTPMENHLGEIWSLFHFLMPGFLGSQKRFTELFRNPIEKQGDPDRLTQLRARVTPFMLRRTKALVASELPPKVESITRVELSGKQADLYETIRLGMEKTVREALNNKGLAKSQITILDALLKLRQVCCDPKLLKLPAAQKVKTSAKLEQLMEMLPEMVAEGRRILLFSQFTTMLTLIEAELKKRNIPWVKLTGASQNRDALIEQFTSGAVPIFLISLKAGGVGLNLPQADTVIHYDPWWNPAAENQATDRAHRIGQTHTVFVYKLVAQGTIEERILALQERKAALADSMYSGATGRKQPLFTEGDLAELLKPLSA